MSTDHESVEFALLHPSGELEFGYAPSSDSLNATLRAHIAPPEQGAMGTSGMGRLS